MRQGEIAVASMTQLVVRGAECLLLLLLFLLERRVCG